MTPQQYCEQKAAPHGSAFYYSLRRVPLVQRNALIALMAFYKEIENITLEYADLNVAHLKLNWWRDEMIKAQEGVPTHPVALQLQATLPLVSLSPLQLIEIIEGLEQNLTLPSFAKFEDVVIHFMRTAGKREWLVAQILQPHSGVEQEVIYQLALVIEFTHYIQYLRRYVRRGLIYFSEAELNEFRVTSEQLQKYKTTPNITHLLKAQINKILTMYAQAQKNLTGAQQEIFIHILIRCEMSKKILSTIESSGFSVLENFIDLTPVRYWWIAWRC